jgi:ornithine carbamoyltransferase
MCNSYIEASIAFEFKLNIATPSGYEPSTQFAEENSNIQLFSSPEEAAGGADLVVTDVWSSMGQHDEKVKKTDTFKDYQVNEDLLDLANKEAIFMHCLPAHRGEEISKDLLEDRRSAVWQEAGNRLHTQKALLEFLVTSN